LKSQTEPRSITHLSFFSTNSVNGFREWCFVAVEKWLHVDVPHVHSDPVAMDLRQIVGIDQWHVCNNQYRATPETHPVKTRVEYDNATFTLSLE
jgi:hypothetical protein